MIYNLIEYIKTNVSRETYNYVANGWQKNTPDNAISINDGGGDLPQWFDRNDFSIQIMSRGQDKTVAKTQIMDTYSIINKKFGLILPEVTVGGELYPQVKTWKIVAAQLPGFIGNDENGRALFSVNFIITTD